MATPRGTVSQGSKKDYAIPSTNRMEEQICFEVGCPLDIWQPSTTEKIMGTKESLNVVQTLTQVAVDAYI